MPACPASTCRGRLIEENMWRAMRHGLDGELLDLERGEAYPASARRSSAC